MSLSVKTRKISTLLCFAIALLLIAAFSLPSFADGLTAITPASGSGIEMHRNSINGNYILGLDVDNHTLADFKASLANDAGQIIAYRNNVTLSDTALLGTGCTVSCVDASNISTVYEQASVVLHGDLDGDGAIDAFDLFYCDMAQNSRISFDDIYSLAADTDSDGTVDLDDYTAVRNSLESDGSAVNQTEFYVFYNTFTTVFEHTDEFLYRIGNGNTVNLGQLFAVDTVGDNAVNSANVNIKVEAVDNATSVYGSGSNLASGSTAKCTYTKNASDWTQSTLKFTGEGPVRITINESNGAEYTLNLEVVNANNATANTSATSANIVLLNDVTASSGITVSGNKTLYGNGFTIDGSNCSLSNHGCVVSLSNGTLNNVSVIGPRLNSAAVYWSDDDYINTVRAAGTSFIYNCYIAYSRSPLMVLDNVGSTTTVENTVFDSGRYCNVFVKDGNLALHNVTTINQPRLTANGNMRVGYGIVIGDEASGTILTATGYLKQYNWLGKNNDKNYCVADNSNSTSNTVMTTLFTNMYSKAGEYTATYNGDTYINAGILCLKDTVPRAGGDALSAYGYKSVSIGGFDGWVMTPVGSTAFNAGESLKYYSSTDYESSEQIPTVPAFTWNYPSTYKDGAINLSFDTGDSVSLNPNILTAAKYSAPLSVTVKMNGVDYTGQTITFNTEGTYILQYTVNDPYNFDHLGVASSREYVKELPVIVSEIKASIKAPEFTFYDKNGNSLGSKIVEINGVKYIMPNVNATSDTVKSTTVSGTTVYCPVVESRFKDNSSDFNYLLDIFSGVNIKNYTDENGSSTTYSKTTNITDLPSSLTWITSVSWNGKGWIGYARDSSYGLYRKSEAMGSNQSEHTATVQFKFEAGNGEVYYYYIYYHADAHNRPSCVADGTLVTMADGSKKAVEDVKVGDMVMTWSMWNGCYEAQPVVMRWYHGTQDWDVLTLNFSDGTDVRMINQHGFFDVDENTYVYITAANVDDYIGHRFVKQKADGTNEAVTLDGYMLCQETVGSYSLQTAFNENFIVEGMLSMTGEDYVGRFEYFDIGEGMKYDADKMQADIDRYGLYSYEEFSDYLSPIEFELFNGKYFKILVGKGVLTYEDILDIIADNLNR